MQSMVNLKDLPSIVHCLGRRLQLFVAGCNPFPTGTGPQNGLWLTTVGPLRAVGICCCFALVKMWKEFFFFPPRKGLTFR